MNQATLSGFGRALGSWAAGLGSWLANLPSWLFVLLLVAFGVVRNGVNVLGTWYSTYPFLLESFPTPVHPFSVSWASMVPAWLLGVNSDTGWSALHVVAVGLVAVGLVLLPMRLLPDIRGRVVALVVVASPMFTVLVHEIGRYDVWIIAGGVILALASRLWVVGLGALLAVLGNPDQALALSVCLLLVAASPSLSWLRPRAYTVVGVVGLGWLAGQFWFAAYGKLEVTRLGLMGRILGLGGEASPADEILTGRFSSSSSWLTGQLESLFTSLPLLVFSWFGVFWLIAIYLVWVQRGSGRWLAGLGLVALPAVIASVFGIDGTREFVPIAWPIFLVLAYWGLVQAEQPVGASASGQRRVARGRLAPVRLAPEQLVKWRLALGVTALAAVFVPAVYVSMGRAISPYLEVSEFIFLR
jgi:hypothetical protein